MANNISTLLTGDVPDFARFMKVVQTQDLARPNLFLVRFGDFRSTMKNDQLLDFTSDIFDKSGISNLIPGLDGDAYTWNRIQDIASNTISKHLPPNIKNILGAYDPSLIRMIPGGGEFIDAYFGAGYDVNKDLALMVKSVNLPSSSLETQVNKTDRMPFTEVKGRSTGNISITFYCSPDYAERRLMLAWMNSVHNNKKNVYSFYHSYAKSIDIMTLDRRGRIVSGVNGVGCFPTNVGEVVFDVENGNQVSLCTVEFSCSDATHIGLQPKDNLIDDLESVTQRILKGLKGIVS
ncbi:MAG: hypothetical protein ACRC3J_05460 [Culicoidibacterales bacterium]